MGWSQSTLTFPRQFPLAEQSSTGFAVVNPGTVNTNITFVMYNTAGQTVSQSSWVIPAKGQLSKLASELFPQAASGGWVEATSPATGLKGFWLGGDFATYGDGGEAAASGLDLLFPLVAGQAEINIVNIRNALNTVTFRLRGTSGTDLTTVATQVIQPRGVYQAQASALFPNADLSQAMYIRVSGTQAFSGTSVIRGFLVNTESAVLNAVNAISNLSTLNFVHVVSGPAGSANYTTSVGVISLASSSQTVTFTFHPETSGAPIVVQRSLPASGALRETAQNLFGFSAGFQNGWVNVSAPSPITGFMAYGETSSGGLAAVPVQAAPQSSMFFGHIAGLPVWYTGIALLNDSTMDANVEVFAITPAGTLVGGAANVPTAAFTLPAGHKSAKLLSELIPATAAQNGGFVYVRTTNNVPLYGIELFGSNSGPILSNVAASGLAPIASFTPPNVSEPLTLTSVSPVRVTRGSTITLSGNGFSPAASNNTIAFTSATGTVEVPSATASVTVLTVAVPITAITGPVLVRSGGQNSPAFILEVTATQTTMIQSSVTVNGGQTTGDVDIYVPPPAGILNALIIGAADIGAPRFLLGPNSQDLPRGQSKLLIVAGFGISRAGGSTVTISGSGVTVSDLIAVEYGVQVKVTVDSNAAVGPRTVFVTNANLDTTALTGGVYIR
ncbi:MAG: hypothetical protein DMG13_13100 [Acidobacteria bacterium]|nr:MAG: hypothetical protein DMG13_13100 [Acidobacteriota bacterium]